MLARDFAVRTSVSIALAKQTVRLSHSNPYFSPVRSLGTSTGVLRLTIAGLTLLYCAWLAPPGYLDVMSAISDCNLMLYVMAERSPAAQKYRDIFERIKMNVLDVVERGSVSDEGVLDAAMAERCRTLDKGLLDTVRTDYEQIISELAKDTNGFGLDERPTTSSFTSYHQDSVKSATSMTTPPQWSMSPGPMLDYGVGHTFGTFVDAAFMFNFDDFGAFNMDTGDGFSVTDP